MTLRPWIAVGALLAVLLSNGVLIWQERLLPPRPAPAVRRSDEPLRALRYTPATRRANFAVMGLTSALAEGAAARAERWTADEAALERVLDEGRRVLRPVFCPGPLPPPWAALEVLIAEEGGERRVVEPRRGLERQAWFATSGAVPLLYARLEQGSNRRADATLAGVSAVLVGREARAAQGEPVAPSPDSGAIAEYFGLMHVLTELANRDGGICAG